MNLNNSTIFWLKLLCIALLILSFAKLPYGYYAFLRIVVTGTAIYSYYLYYVNEKKFWMPSFGVIVIVFNPFIPIYFEKNIWSIIDVITAIVLIISIYTLKEYTFLKKIYK